MTEHTPARGPESNRIYELAYPSPLGARSSAAESATPTAGPSSEDEHGETGLPLIVALNGYADAGHAIAHSAKHLLEALRHSTVATFNVDELVDYRSRRPAVTLSDDKISSMQELELKLYALEDAQGQQFLLLAGPEPDLKWDAFSEAIVDLAHRFSASKVVSLYAAPMAVPHTRPSLVSAHSADPALVRKFHSWQARIMVPGSASLQAEYKLSQLGFTTIGLTTHVPNYIGNHEYPPATHALLSAFSDISGRQIPLKALEADMERITAKLTQEVEESHEVAAIVEAMEKQYDSEVERLAKMRNNNLLAPGESIPTSDEIGAEFEAFLAKMALQQGTPDADNGPVEPLLNAPEGSTGRPDSRTRPQDEAGPEPGPHEAPGPGQDTATGGGDAAAGGPDQSPGYRSGEDPAPGNEHPGTPRPDAEQ